MIYLFLYGKIDIYNMYITCNGCSWSFVSEQRQNLFTVEESNLYFLFKQAGKGFLDHVLENLVSSLCLNNMAFQHIKDLAVQASWQRFFGSCIRKSCKFFVLEQYGPSNTLNTST